MTTQATGDEQNPAAEQPLPAAEEPRPTARNRAPPQDWSLRSTRSSG